MLIANIILCVVASFSWLDYRNLWTLTQGEIRRFRNSEKWRKHDTSTFRYVSAGRIQRGNSIEKNDHNVSRFRSISADWNAYGRFIRVSAKRIRSENRDIFPRGFSSFGKMKWRQFSVHVYYWICALNNTWTIVLHHANTSIFHQKKPGKPRKLSGKINIYTWCIHTACFINIFRKRREPNEGYGWKTSYSIIHLT